MIFGEMKTSLLVKAIFILYFLMLPAVQVSRCDGVQNFASALCRQTFFNYCSTVSDSIGKLVLINNMPRTTCHEFHLISEFKERNHNNLPPSKSEAFLLSHPDAAYYCVALRDEVSSSAFLMSVGKYTRTRETDLSERARFMLVDP